MQLQNLKRAIIVAATLAFCLPFQFVNAQELQLHYDFRHTIDPKNNSRNFPLMVFKYFKELDTLGTGAFLFESQTFFNGAGSNVGQTFLQLSQTLKFWKPGIYFVAYYSGGLGVAPPSFGFYIANAFGGGLSTTFKSEKIWSSFQLAYRHSASIKPSHDIQLTTYVGGGLLNYRLMYSCSFVSWLTKKDSGMPGDEGKKGRKASFFADPQI